MASISIIAIKGNYLDSASEIFEAFKYVDLNNEKQFNSWNKSTDYLYNNYSSFSKRDIALREIWSDNGWTIICDPEMVDLLDDNAIVTLAKKLNAVVLTFLIQTTSGTYWFAKYNPDKQRHFVSTDGQISENFGPPLTEEQGLAINEGVFEDDIIQLAHKFGVNVEATDPNTTFLVKELGYNDELKKELEKFKQEQPQKLKTEQKPWWKIW